ncbi:MAG: 23S rRNA (guanosine(2251)-2'-O)-methyltransferase RlmB [Veillonellaceae bacterium]|nr:23S rRNA (guanosine(2251)-2'-O)-methyltransferase RlmB [Veillonellaceae bacterium]
MKRNERSRREVRRAKEQRAVGGRNSVREALASGRVQACYVQARPQGELRALVRAAQAAGVPVTECSPAQLEAYVPGLRHQGIVAILPPFAYADLTDLIAAGRNREHHLLVLLDGVEDPHNVGAIIRTATAAGAAGVLLPERRGAGVTETVHKTSAGTAELLPIARIGNPVRTLQELQTAGYWVIGADVGGDRDYTAADWRGKTVLVLGNEGRGMARLTREHCDFLVSIPLYGPAESLNVSVAAGLLLYEAARAQRRGDE